MEVDKASGDVVYKIKKVPVYEIWRIERLKGELAGEFVRMREDFAKDLIDRGYARRVG